MPFSFAALAMNPATVCNPMVVDQLVRLALFLTARGWPIRLAALQAKRKTDLPWFGAEDSAMGKDPVVDDYGGSKYGSRRRNKRAGQLSFRCVDCGKYRFVTRRELSRASRVSCTACGGPVVETMATAKKVMPSAAKQNLKGRSATARRCRECGIPIRSNEDMVSHFTIKPECLDAYADSVIEADCVWFRYFDKPTPNESQGEFMQALKMVVPATIIIEKTGRVSRAKWSAKARVLEEDVFRWREIFAAGNRTEVRLWINDNFGPVELAR